MAAGGGGWAARAARRHTMAGSRDLIITLLTEPFVKWILFRFTSRVKRAAGKHALSRIDSYCYIDYSSDMNVNLGPVLDGFIAELLKSGMYQSQSEVVREGLRLLKER